MAAEDMKCSFGLKGRVMKDELSSPAEFIPLSYFYHTSAEGIQMSTSTFSENVAEDVYGAF